MVNWRAQIQILDIFFKIEAGTRSRLGKLGYPSPDSGLETVPIATHEMIIRGMGRKVGDGIERGIGIATEFIEIAGCNLADMQVESIPVRFRRAFGYDWIGRVNTENSLEKGNGFFAIHWKIPQGAEAALEGFPRLG